MQSGSPSRTVYVLDTNILLEAFQRYYAFDICPGFWACLLHHGSISRICSIDKVKAEIRPGDDLAKWAAAMPSSFFRSSINVQVQQAYAKVIGWANSQPQFTSQALAQFASVADGWLVAHAMASNMTVVTHERNDPNAKRVVKIPNACDALGVPYCDLYTVLRGVKASFA